MTHAEKTKLTYALMAHVMESDNSMADFAATIISGMIESSPNSASEICLIVAHYPEIASSEYYRGI